jgi:hypothetical protein
MNNEDRNDGGQQRISRFVIDLHRSIAIRASERWRFKRTS